MKLKEKIRELVGKEIYSSIGRKKREIELALYPQKILMKQFENVFGYKFDINNPQTFNEKLMWLKLNWRDELATKCADKYEVREYIRDMLKTEKYLNELYGIYNSVNDIDLSALPNQFVLKVTHGTGQNIICKDKDKLNWKEEMQKLNQWLKINAHVYAGEWVYKDIKPRIICEKLIETEHGTPPIDYKILCFNGMPRVIYVATDRENHNTKFNFYSTDWEPIAVKNYYPRNLKEVEKPKRLDEMMELASILAADFPHARVDFYYENDQIIFGEITFFHMAGLTSFEPHDFDLLLGGWLKLPK